MLHKLPSALEKTVNRARHVHTDIPTARAMIACMDLTCLTSPAGPSLVFKLANDAHLGPHGTVAALYVNQHLVQRAFHAVSHRRIWVGTVINYPAGRAAPDSIQSETRRAVLQGAREIEIPLDVDSFLAGDKDAVRDRLAACKGACGPQVRMKVMLNAPRFRDFSQLYEAATLAIDCGADMLVTAPAPRGSLNVNAPDLLPAAATILQAIKDNKRPVGFKAGGIEDSVRVATAHIHLARAMMGKDWIDPARFRIGGRNFHKEAAALLNTPTSFPRPLP